MVLISTQHTAVSSQQSAVSNMWPVNGTRYTVHEVRGFTLVELLIAATMMSVLFVGLGAHLRGGLSVWRRTTAMTERLQRERVVWDQLARDLANAVPYQDGRDDEFTLDGAAFGGSELQWMTAPPGAVGVQVVRYACTTLEDGMGLWRTRQSIGAARADEAASPELLLPGCSTLEVRYGYEETAGSGTLVWDAAWAFEDELPQVLEISLQMENGRTLTQRLALPAGVLKPRTESESS